MTDMNDYDDVEDSAVDEDEAKAAEKGASDEATEGTSDGDVAEAETLTVTAKLKQRQALEDEVAAFLARGGRITEVPPDESAHD
ncbi:hypothetical protein [Acinetobacter zhairhuonensis]|jgi:hypothetical protein|uniref:hypothetical protein n=1 Tax=Acinetobacter sp. A7.4 TaxID=2919921 RepID=UPI001F4DE0D4|nr:hypothetical protein [Acinetobacter sp. A7.4]MCJ8159983.1 hypothetical protein [Acinetobacter sp. A7.4]